ncbi:DUF6950 family protein [Acuticoccus sediminis]|uniref:DUF6950 family protein n=1 Tax=Acuticoccus sediminis TaxID=2184697 RepID=UPI001CFD8D3F|nr:hypothetical protein [Acuticoccus sediminis]
MPPELVPFLRWLAREPFAWGQLDCLLALGSWWEALYGVDPAAHLRGTYHDEATCAAVLAGQGHAPRLVAGIARNVGAPMTRDDPRPGDAAVLRFPGTWYGAIRTPSGRWAIKSGEGLLVTRAGRPVAIWRTT